MQAIRWSILALCAPALFAQPAPAAPAHWEFEVASVKPAPPIVAGPEVAIGIRIDGAQFSCSSYSLRDYLRFAYDLKPFQIVGPEWIAEDRYTISAKMPEGGRSHVREMLQSLLAERFNIKSHPDKKEFPVYALVVGKGGLKMTELPEGPPDMSGNVEVKATGGRGGVNVDLGNGAYFGFANNKLEGKRLTMPRFADMLTMFADRPVIDNTGLKGAYDFTIQLSEEDYTAMLIRSALKNGVTLPPQALRALEASGDTLLNAVQMLGLKLEPRKEPLDVIVIDSADKTPIEN